MNSDNYFSMVDLYIKQIKESVPEPALYEQLAEECNELAQACLKKARKLRDENYTPKSMEEINSNLEEEYTDVHLSAKVCGIVVNWNTFFNKANRWVDRNKNRD